MRNLVLAGLFTFGLASAAPGWAQHDGVNLDRLPMARGPEVNTISITPVSPLQAQPIMQVDTAPLPDVGPDRLMERYLDGVFEGQIAAGRIPGAAIIVIRNGEVVLKKGYGFANIDKRTRIDPDTTQFRVASISKLFTAMAAMQEVESGRLSLDANVNDYLKTFKLAPVGTDPVTLGSLLDHTSGFDDKYLGIATALGAPREKLSEHLARNMPRLVLPVGKVFNYSNYGSALAGHLAAQSAGKDFRALMAERFFGPLQMTRSSFGIPEPAPDTMATPYSRTPVGLLSARHDQVAVYPAGDLVTTADDLSRFMLALMKDGGGLVTSETLKSMRSARIVPGKTGDAWGLGFALGESNGVAWYGHGGAWPGFAAEMRLGQDIQSGFLILMNTDNSFDVVQPIVNSVTDAVWPNPIKRPQPVVADAILTATELQGTFISVRRSRGDFTKLGAAITPIRLTLGVQGELIGTFGTVPQILKFEPVADGVWRERTFRWRLSAFDGGGGATRTGVLLGPFAFERAGFADDLVRQMPLLIMSAFVFGALLLAWSFGALNRKMFGEPIAVVPLVPRILGGSASALGLVFLVGFAGTMASMKDQNVLNGEIGAIPAMLVLPLLIAPAALAVCIFAIRGFGSGLRARMAQAGFVLLTLSLMFVLWFVWTWNLHIFAR